jgi:hypothetical protein
MPRRLLPGWFIALLVLVLMGFLGAVTYGAASAHADPAPLVCNGPGLPPCAPPADPATMCAVIAWRTWTPCNWYGVQVPQGTPGSWG